MSEQWKDIPGFEGLYQISDLGRVFSVRRGKLRKLNNTGRGYMQVMLSKEGRREYPLVHRLVAETFIPNPENKPHINHINGNKSDNRVENLEWCTMSENLCHRHRVLNQPGCRSRPVVCTNTGEVFSSAKAAALALGASQKGILRVCHKQQKTIRKNKLNFKFKEE